jgi:hypothetical protein
MNFVYCAWYGDDLYKVGFSGNPEVRVASLFSGNWPRPYIIKLWKRPNGDAHKVEQRAHKILAYYWRHSQHSNELFSGTREQICDGVDRAVAEIDRKPVPYTPPAGGPPLAAMIGFAPIGAGFAAVAKIIDVGVPFEQIYDDPRPLIKALRAGDTLVLDQNTPSPYSACKLAKRGITLQLV